MKKENWKKGMVKIELKNKRSGEKSGCWLPRHVADLWLFDRKTNRALCREYDILNWARLNGLEPMKISFNQTA